MDLLAPLTAFLVAWLVARNLPRWGRLPMDHPNARSLHARPVPRSGGLAIWAGMIAAAMFLPQGAWAPLLPAALLGAVSFADDVWGLRVAWRLASHVALVAGFLWWLGLPAGVGWWALPVLVWMANLYNFMDGADGLAGGMAVVGFSVYGVAAWDGGQSALALLSFSVAAAATGFLVYNFPPAKLFMGDAGSIPLGFLAAAVGVLGWREATWGAWFPLLVFSPFIVDATVTLGKRLLRGEKVWRAHREHYYQRLVRAGLGHRGTALLEYGLMLACGAAALALHRFGGDGAALWALAGGVVGYGGLMAAAESYVKRRGTPP